MKQLSMYCTAKKIYRAPQLLTRVKNGRIITYGNLSPLLGAYGEWQSPFGAGNPGLASVSYR